jgi:hypothetical protein
MTAKLAVLSYQILGGSGSDPSTATCAGSQVTCTDAGGFEAFVAEANIRDRCGQPDDLGAMSTNWRWYKACSGSGHRSCRIR